MVTRTRLGSTGWKWTSSTPAAGSPAQARSVEVVDVAVLAVEQVEDVERDADVLRRPGSRRAARRAWSTSIAPSCPRPAGAARSSAAGRGRTRARAWVIVAPSATTLSTDPGMRLADRIGVGEARARSREVGVEQQPRRRDPVVVPFDAAPAAGPARLGLAGVADEDQLGAELELPEGERALQTRDDLGAQAQLAAFRADQRRHGPDRIACLRCDPWRSSRARRCCGSRCRS